MEEKNRKLAKENNDLKFQISQKTRLQEELMKKTIKEEYKQIVTYKDMVKSLDEGISALEDALFRCREVREAVVKNKSLLTDITNVPRVSGAEVKAYLGRGAREGVIREDVTNDTFTNDTFSNDTFSNEISRKKHSTKNDIEGELFNKWGNR